MKALLFSLALIVAVIGSCPTEVTKSAALCNAVAAASDTCGVFYTGTADGQSPGLPVNCLLQRSVRIECSSTAPPLACSTSKPCFHLESDGTSTPTVTVTVQGCALVGTGFVTK